jgi:hypothetical protein
MVGIVRAIQTIGVSGGSGLVTPSVAVSSFHSTSVPPGSTNLGSDGMVKPLATSDQVICTVPVHINPDNSVAFFVAGGWRRPDGSLAP